MISAPYDDHARAERSVLWWFVVQTIAGVVIGVPVGFVLVGPGFSEGFREAAPPLMAKSLDAFLMPMAGGLVAAAFVGTIVSCGDRIRASSPETQLKATWFCVGLGALVGIGLYGYVSWELPRFLQRANYPAGTPSDGLQVHPFLLTTPELYVVQASFRKIGGFSDRVAHTLELRLWLSASMVALALQAAVLMLVGRPRSRVLRVLIAELVALFFMTLAMGATVGPALFLRPRRTPLNVAWVIVGTIGVASFWWLRRHLASPSTVTSVMTPSPEPVIPPSANDSQTRVPR